MKRTYLTVLTVVALLSPLAATAPAVRANPSLTVTRQRVDVGGYRIYLECAGSGSPTVVLDDAGFLDNWLPIRDVMAGFTRTCVYDREGLGQSDQGPRTTTSVSLVADVFNLLHHGKIPGPYILAGVGFGGTNMRLYASLHPGEVAGLVLVDAVPPDLLSTYTVFQYYDVNMRLSRNQVKAAGVLGNLPLVVLSHGIPYSLPSRIERRWSPLQRTLRGLSSNAILVEAAHSGYGIIGDQPQLVVVAIQHVLLAVRHEGHAIGACDINFEVAGGICVR